MPQQINLCTAVLTPQRQRFQAQSLLTILLLSLLVLAALGSFWLWSLEGSSQTYRQTLDAQTSEIKSLQAVIQSSRAAAGPADPALMRNVQEQQARVQERESLLQLARQGLFKAGEGHSDRLRLLAQSIPADAWITSLKADAQSLEISGFALTPESLNEWVARLGQQPLMRGQKLSAVTLNYVAQSAASGLQAKPMWSFSLQSVESLAQATGPAAQGDKP
jgi:Tfp pilus assembly protein PilN